MAFEREKQALLDQMKRLESANEEQKAAHLSESDQTKTLLEEERLLRSNQQIASKQAQRNLEETIVKLQVLTAHFETILT